MISIFDAVCLTIIKVQLFKTVRPKQVSALRNWFKSSKPQGFQLSPFQPFHKAIS